jgi:hypothetical protein
MNVPEGYQLFFSWEGIRYEKEVALFKSAWFEGPVIKNALQLQPNDKIDLDFTAQNLNVDLFLPQNFFIAKLSWKEVEYKDDKILLKGCMLSHNVGGSLKNLQDDYRILIDCSKHEEYMHRNFLVYSSWVLKPTNDLIQQEE